jgi:hypothetical protein
VISRYDLVHGRNSFQRGKTKGLEKERLNVAIVDAGNRSLAATSDEFVTYDVLRNTHHASSRTHETWPTYEHPRARRRAGARRLPGRRRRASRTRPADRPRRKTPHGCITPRSKRMEPSFSKKALGFKSFSDFLRSRSDPVDLDETSTNTHSAAAHRSRTIAWNRAAAPGSNDVGEALPPNGIGHTTGRGRERRKASAFNQRVRGSKP